MWSRVLESGHIQRRPVNVPRKLKSGQLWINHGWHFDAGGSAADVTAAVGCGERWRIKEGGKTVLKRRPGGDA